MSAPILGILGGMGPLASSGFVNFLYQKCQQKFSKEQSYPRVILVSDPTIPDRMECVHNQQNKKILDIFENKIQELLFLGATKILICCFTAHYFLDKLSLTSQQSVIDLGLLLKNYLDQQKTPTLILGSELVTKSQLISSQYGIYPEKKDFQEIHHLIYKIKLNGPKVNKNMLLAFSQNIGKSYAVSRILFTCTEFHLIYQLLSASSIDDCAVHILDGLNITAEFIIKKMCNNSHHSLLS
jgi:aspartate racemase